MKSAEARYKGRHGPRQHKSGGEVSLRMPSRQPDGSTPKSATIKSHDVKDGYLRGLAGGESHPFYDAKKPKR
jgi:hypothetical protein